MNRDVLAPTRYTKSKNASSCSSQSMLLILMAVTIFMFILNASMNSARHSGRKSLPISSTFTVSSTSTHKDGKNVMLSQKSSEEVSQKKLEYTSPKESDNFHYHLVFSTDCSDYQHWQAYFLFHSALRVGQPGRVTRIASGCTDREAKDVIEWHNEHIKSTMSEKFGIHLTPHFSSVENDVGQKSKDYKFFNKPFGLRHWLEHGEHIRSNDDSGGKLEEDVIVILIDPDMSLLRPILADFSNERETIIRHNGKNGKKTRVQHGTPFAQTYGMGASWLKRNVSAIAGHDSPALNVSNYEARNLYQAGPPYLATARDMYNIAIKWTEYAPKVFEEHPHLMAEMYAYCIAAAHLELPHQLIESMMVSSITAPEAWTFIDRIPHKEACSFALNLNHSQHALPSVIHYCQRYMIGKWFFGKRAISKQFFSCESPLFKIPPMDIVEKFDYFIPPPPHKPAGEKKKLTSSEQRRVTFTICALISTLNEAGDYFKRNHCDGVEGTRNDKSFNLWEGK